MIRSWDNPTPSNVLPPERPIIPATLAPAWWCRWSLAIVEGQRCPLCGRTKAQSTDTKGMVL